MNEIQRRKRRINPKMIVATLAGLYTVSPVDAIPDFIPVAGQLDDGMVILLAVLAVCAMMLMGGSEND